MRQRLLYFLLTLLPFVGMQAQTTYYDLYVCGRSVSSNNANNILGDASKSFVYDDATKTLTINGDVSVEETPIIQNGIDGLTLNIARDVTFTSTYSSCMIISFSGRSMTVKGNGKLTMSNPNGTGGCFLVQGDATLTIDNMTIDGEGQNVFWGNKTTEKLVLKNSTIHAKCTGGGFGAIFELGGGITFDNCHIALPLGAYVDMTTFMGIVQSNGQIARDVTIEPGEGVEYYPLLICGQYVNANNADDVLGDGVFSYDAEAEILRVHGDCTYNEDKLILNEGVEDLIIFTASDSKLSGPTTIVSVAANTIFSGPGKLTLQSADGTAIVVSNFKAVNFEEANVDITGFKAFMNTGSTGLLTFKYSTVHAKTQNTAFMCYAGFAFDDCEITQPEGGTIQNFRIVDSEGNDATEVTIEPKVETYDLKIFGQQVTSRNAADILGDGAFSYDAENKVLTISGDGNGDHAVSSEIAGLTVKVTKDVTLTTTNAGCTFEENVTITGPGKLTVKSEEDCCIYAINATVTIDNMTISVDGKWGFAGWPASEHLIVRNSKIYAKGWEGAICDFSSIPIEGCEITQPEGGHIDGGNIVDSEGNVATEVTISYYETYGILICGTQVTSVNAHDILGDGAFSYDDDNKVLTVKGDASSNTTVISINFYGVTVRVENDVTLTSSGNVLRNATVIEGPGSLTLISTEGTPLWRDGYLTIRNTTVNAYGLGGIAANPDYLSPELIIENANVHAKGTTNGAIYDFNSIVLKDCELTLPEHGYIDGGTIRDSEGHMAKEVIIKALKKYDLSICDTRVTSDNASDVLGDGVFSYDAENNVLTISGNHVEEEPKYIIENSIDGLTINVATDAEMYGMFVLFANTTLTGEGKLTLDASNNCGIYAYNATLTIEDMDLEISGGWGIAGNPIDEHLIVRNSTIHATGWMGAICDLSSITLEDCFITLPEDGYIDGGNIMDSEGNVAKEVTIVPLISYGLYICNTQVTTINAADVLGDGVFSYDTDTQTLTISGNHIEDEAIEIVRNWMSGLTINVATDAEMYGFFDLFGNTTLTGEGKLTINTAYDCGIYLENATLTIEDMNLDVSGGWGIAGDPENEHLIIRNSNIHAKGLKGAICDFNSITLEGCSITQPEGGYISDGAIMDSNGYEAEEVTITSDENAIEGIAADSNKNAVRYNLSGQRVGRDYRGIVIENGKKTLVK
jgi:hypothetical protein